MEVSREELAVRFQEMSDEELLKHVRSGDLTPLAVEVATSILNSRGLGSSALSDPQDEGLELPETMDVEFSAREVDLEATQEVLPTPALKPR